jgi:hypothetical protein
MGLIGMSSSSNSGFTLKLIVKKRLRDLRSYALVIKEAMMGYLLGEEVTLKKYILDNIYTTSNYHTALLYWT